MRVLMIHCWAIDNTLLVIQYNTKPEGKKKNITLKASGMIHISFACIGSGGAGFNAVCSTVVRVITIGNMPTGTPNHTPSEVSGAAKSWIHITHGALRISTVDKSTQYKAMKTGICIAIEIGRAHV